MTGPGSTKLFVKDPLAPDHYTDDRCIENSRAQIWFDIRTKFLKERYLHNSTLLNRYLYFSGAFFLHGWMDFFQAKWVLLFRRFVGFLIPQESEGQ